LRGREGERERPRKGERRERDGAYQAWWQSGIGAANAQDGFGSTQTVTSSRCQVGATCQGRDFHVCSEARKRAGRRRGGGSASDGKAALVTVTPVPAPSMEPGVAVGDWPETVTARKPELLAPAVAVTWCDYSTAGFGV
jgi:hypothetical protein